MSCKVVSLFEEKKKRSGSHILTDEWIDRWAEEYIAEKEQRGTDMTFEQWVEYKRMRYFP